MHYSQTLTNSFKAFRDNILSALRFHFTNPCTLSIIIQEFDQQDDEVVLVNGDEIRAWQKKEIFAKNCIFATITKEMKQHLYTPGLTSAQMWNKLSTQYEIRTVEHLHLLWQEFYDFAHKEGLKIIHSVTVIIKITIFYSGPSQVTT